MNSLTTTQSLETAFRENYSKLYTLAFRLSGNRDDAEDLLQNTFLNALTGIEKFRGECSHYTWLYRILINASKKYGRENRRLPVEEYAEDHSMTQQEVYDTINRFGRVEEQALVNLTKENCLQMFMNCIPSKYRVIYTLRVILHLSIRETSDILELSDSLVKVNLHQARKLIARHFEGRCSLMGKGEMCDCRSYAAFIAENGKPGGFVNFKVIHDKEQKAAGRFYEEIKNILNVDDLYTGRIETDPFDQFIHRIKKLIKGKDLKLLSL